MKILVNRKPVEGPWGGGNLFVRAICEHFKNQGWEVTHRFEEDIDVMFMQDPRPNELGVGINEMIQYKNYRPQAKLIHRVNECDARKNTDHMDDILSQCSQFTDLTVFVSNWMRDYHINKGWHCDNTDVIYNGHDNNHFNTKGKKERKPNDPLRIVTHHWSDHRMKGADIYEFIDDFVKDKNMTYTYVGRHKCNFKNTRIIPPISGKDLGDELKQHDVYITGTRWDPGPNHIIEAITSGLPTYAYSQGGGACEFTGEAHVFSDTDMLSKILTQQDFVLNNSLFDTWEVCAEKYFNLITGLK